MGQAEPPGKPLALHQDAKEERSGGRGWAEVKEGQSEGAEGRAVMVLAAVQEEKALHSDDEGRGPPQREDAHAAQSPVAVGKPFASAQLDHSAAAVGYPFALAHELHCVAPTPHPLPALVYVGEDSPLVTEKVAYGAWVIVAPLFTHSCAMV